jgi:hypothetical protein
MLGHQHGTRTAVCLTSLYQIGKNLFVVLASDEFEVCLIQECANNIYDFRFAHGVSKTPVVLQMKTKLTSDMSLNTIAQYFDLYWLGKSISNIHRGIKEQKKLILLCQNSVTVLRCINPLVPIRIQALTILGIDILSVSIFGKIAHRKRYKSCTQSPYLFSGKRKLINHT